jgi:DUF177 domain-containing protein
MMRAIDIRELLAHPGGAARERIEEPIEGLHTELADVPADSPVEGELLLENVVEGVLVSGTLNATMTLRCARCLRDYTQGVEVDVHELYSQQPDPDGDEYEIAPEGSLDPEPMVRDAIGLQLPFAPLCRPDCAGLCERCGGDRNLGECSCEQEVDAHWAPLQGFSEN